MKRFWKIIPAIGLTAGVTVLANAQPPEIRYAPQGDRKSAPAAAGRGEVRGESRIEVKGQPVHDVKVDPQVEAWVKTLAEKITDAHDEIRDSARAGLVAVGPAALPVLNQLANSSDGAKVTASRKLIEAIVHTQQQRHMMLTGGMGMNPMLVPNANLGANRGEGRLNAGQPNAERTAPRGEGNRPEGATPRGEGPNTGRPNAERPNAEKPGTDRPGNRPEGRPEGRPGPDGRPPNPFEAMLKDLDLSEKQGKQANEIMEEFREKMNGLRKQAEDGKLSREEQQPKREAAMKEMMKDMKEILGEDKFSKFEEAMKNMPRPGPRPGGEGEGRPRPPQ